MLVVDKPAGPTSHDVVDRVRRLLGLRRVGHTGTLDPFATGVLPLCLGVATRLARFMSAADKVYRARVRLGFATDTDDCTGEALTPAQPVGVNLAQVRAAAHSLTGNLMQIPPAYSAKRVGGKRLYEHARAGESVERRPCAVQVQRFDVLDLAGDTATLEVACSTGTYVRALARDLGAALGVGGHLTALRRTRSGVFDVEQAVPWELLAPGAEAPTSANEVAERVLGLERLLPELPAVRVDNAGRRAVGHGQPVAPGHVLSTPPLVGGERVRILDALTGELLALALASPAGGLAGGLAGAAAGLVELRPDVVLVESTQRFTG